MNFHGFGDYLCSWRLFVLDTPPKTSIFGHLRVKADQLTCGESYGRVIDSSEGQGHMPYMVNPCAFEGQGWSSDHPVSIPFTLSF